MILFFGVSVLKAGLVHVARLFVCLIRSNCRLFFSVVAISPPVFYHDDVSMNKRCVGDLV
jgi:hypothetical protein